jgi:hypothetical protein
MEKHILISKELIPLEIARRFFGTLLQCPIEKLALAIEWVESATIPLSLDDCAKALVEFAATRKVAISEAESILEALFSLEGLRSSLGWQGPDLVDYLEKEQKPEVAEHPKKEQTELLKRFFTIAKLERTAKAQKIYDGVLPNFEACWSLVEFRPVFDESRTEIVNAIIAATLILKIREYEEASANKTVCFQLDLADIGALISELNRLKGKITALRTYTEKEKRAIDLLNPSKSLKETNGR